MPHEEYGWLTSIPPCSNPRARGQIVLWEGWSAGAPTPALLFRSWMCFSSESPHCHWIVFMYNLCYFWMHLSLKKCFKSSPNRLWPLMVQLMGADYKLFWNNPFIFSHSPLLQQCHGLDPWHQLLHATDLLSNVVFSFSSDVKPKLTHTLASFSSCLKVRNIP